MKINSIKYLNKYYQLEIDEKIYNLNEEQLVMLKIVNKCELNELTFNKIIRYDQLNQYIKKIENKIKYRIRSSYEVENLIKQLTKDQLVLDELMNYFKQTKQINDDLFKEILINDIYNLSLKGSEFVKNKLEMHKITYNDDDLKLFYTNSSERIQKILNKKKSIFSGSSKIQKNKIISYLIAQGYSKDQIYEVVENIAFKTNLNQLITFIQKERITEFVYQDKKIQKLLRKGYTVQELKDAIDENNLTQSMV